MIIEETVISIEKQQEILENILWAKDNCWKLFSSRGDIYLWVDTKVENCYSCKSLTELNSFILGLRAGK